MVVRRKIIESRLERLRKKREELEAQIRQVKVAARETERQERRKAIFALGKVVETAGLLNIDKATLLGLLIQSKEILSDEETVSQLKKKGDKVLQQSQ